MSLRIFSLRKKSGAYRTIAAPDDAQKLMLRALVGPLTDRARQLDVDGVMHGFARARSPVTAARRHIGRRYTLGMDLTDFFDGVTSTHLRGKIPAATIAQIMPVAAIDGRDTTRCWQGLPTSPAAANIAAAAMDRAILTRLAKITAAMPLPEVDGVTDITTTPDTIIYTRYADDLTFSFDRPETRKTLLAEIPQITSRCGWRVNANKTRFMPASAGRREICGVLIDGDGSLHARRSCRRKLRAAQHQRNTISAAGLTEWCALKLPRVRVATVPAVIPSAHALEAATIRAAAHIEMQRTANVLCDFWNLAPVTVPHCDRADITEGDYLITRDPAYVLGMSSYTTGWASCMTQPSGDYRKSVRFWAANAGTSIATLLSTRTTTHAGITRRVMQARCLLHHLRDGRIAYDRFYGDDQSIAALRGWLTTWHGAVAAKTLPTGTRVQGNVPRSIPAPWADNMHFYAMRDKEQRVWVAQK